jgi:hypothetical protein
MAKILLGNQNIASNYETFPIFETKLRMQFAIKGQYVCQPKSK